jgi:acyl carrier protein
MTPDRILADLADLLRDFQGREYSDVIGRRTRFFGDLGFASIDAVVLGEALEKRYGRKLPFNQLLAELGQRQAEDLEVGELADFLSRHLPSDMEE